MHSKKSIKSFVITNKISHLIIDSTFSFQMNLLFFQNPHEFVQFLFTFMKILFSKKIEAITVQLLVQ